MDREFCKKIFIFKNIYQFNYSVKYVHSSWLQGAPKPNKALLSLKDKQYFEYAYLMHNNGLDTNEVYLNEQDVALHLAALPSLKFKRFLKLLALLSLKNDPSLRIDGQKLKKIKAYFGEFDLKHFIFESNLLLPESLSQGTQSCHGGDFNDEWLMQTACPLVKTLYQSAPPALAKRIDFRFPQELANSSMPAGKLSPREAQTLFTQLKGIFEISINA